MRHAVIMAGGSGTRFWPASRRSKPKQFLALGGDQPLLRATFERLAGLIPPHRVWVVTAAATADLARGLLPELPGENIVSEPCGRDTAACVGLAACRLLAADPEAACVVLPADHVVGEEDRFRAALAAGLAQVEAAGGLLTFGIRPTRAETGYGYLELGELELEREGFAVHRLVRFVEKPDAAAAAAYIAGGSHLWNSGMFAWRAGEILAEIRRQLPLLADGLECLAAAIGTRDEKPTLARVYPELPRISVDFGVMERALRVWTIPVDFPWSDVGAWPAVREVAALDDAGNAVSGPVVALDATGSVIASDGPVVAAIGVRDLVIVASADAVLVAPLAEAQRVKEAVDALAREGRDDVL